MCPQTKSLKQRLFFVSEARLCALADRVFVSGQG
jgi:hypothetical protein